MSTEREFVELVANLFARRRNAHVQRYVDLGDYTIADLIASYAESFGQTTLLLEVRRSVPRNSQRLADALDQLQALRAAYGGAPRASERIDAMLVISGTLSRTDYDSLGSTNVIDGVALIAMAEEVDDELQEETRRVLARDTNESLEDIRHRLLLRVDGLPDLEEIPSGLSHWPAYQRAWSDVLQTLFVPPLEPPEYEHVNASKVNRRDIIFANYATGGFWEFLRNQYGAEFVVADAKNHKGYVTKNHVLQVANYLSIGGLGLFGLIVCRNGMDHSAREVRKEQWLLSRKMILSLTHADLREMIYTQYTEGSADIVLRQKLQDFRLSI